MNQFSYANQHAREGHGDDHLVPAIEDNAFVYCVMEGGQGNAGRTRQRNRAWLYFVTWAAWPVQSKGYSPSLFESAAHSQLSGNGVATARSSHRSEAEFLDDAGNVLAVIAGAGHHANSPVAKNIGRRDDA